MQDLQTKTASENVRRRRETRPSKENNFKRTLSRLAAVLIIGAIVGSMALVINAARNKTTVGLGPAISGKVIFTYHDTSADQDLGVSWSKDGSRLLSVGANVQVWDIHNKKFPGHKSDNNTAPYSASWSPDGKLIADSTANGVEIWNTATGQTLRTCLSAAQSMVLPGQQLAQNSQQTIVPLFSYISHQPQSAGVVETLNATWSPDGKYLAATVGTPMSGGVGLNVYDSTNCSVVWQPVGKSTGKPQPVSDVTWSSDGKYLAWSIGTTVEIREFASHHLIYTYNAGHDPKDPNAGVTIDKVRWSPNGQRIVTVDSLNRIAVWDALTGKHKISYVNHNLSVSGIAWSPDSQYIVSGAYTNADTGQGELRVWDATTGDTIYSTTGQKLILAVAWSPDGKYIALAHGLPINPAASMLPLQPGQGKATISIVKV